MLPALRRLRGSADFRDAQRGRRARASTVVLHLRGDVRLDAYRDSQPDARVDAPDDAPVPQRPTRVGFVVPRAIGPAVTRNRVRRRLRHLVLARLDRLPAGHALVVRALPPAAAASSSQLGADLDVALARLLPSAVGDSRC